MRSQAKACAYGLSRFGAGMPDRRDVTTGTATATPDTPSEGVEGLTFSADAKTLAAVARALPEVHFWDAHSGKKTATWEKSWRRPRPRLFRFLWDTFPSAFKEHAFVPLSVCFTPDGGAVAFGFDNRDNTTVEMWQLGAVPGAKN